MSGDVLADAARAPAAIRMLSANSIMPRVGVSDVERPFFLNMVRRMLVKQGAAGSQKRFRRGDRYQPMLDFQAVESRGGPELIQTNAR